MDNKYKGFESLKKHIRYNGWNVHYQGYDYSKTLLKKSLSPYFYGNPKVAGFLEYLNAFMVSIVDNVKYIRNYLNYAVPKDYKKIN